MNRGFSSVVRVMKFHTTSPVSSGSRVPLIKFIGKRSLVPAPKAAAAAPVPVVEKKSSGLAVDIHHMHGRPSLSDLEIENVFSGGADKIW